MKLSPLLLSGALALAMGLPAVGYAQQAPAPPPAASPMTGHHHHHGGMMHMFRDLNLTDQQRSQIRSIMQQYHQQHPKGSTPDPAARQALRQQILSVLTPEQQAKLKADRERMHSSPEPAPTSSPS